MWVSKAFHLDHPKKMRPYTWPHFQYCTRTSVKTQARGIGIAQFLGLEIDHEMIAGLGRTEAFENGKHLLELRLEQHVDRVLVRRQVTDLDDGRRIGREGAHQHLVGIDA